MDPSSRRTSALVVWMAAGACLACGGGAAGPGPGGPSITSFSLGRTTASVGDSFAVSGTATDPGGGTLTYAWTASPAGCGTFASASSAAATFTAVLAGTCSVQLTASARGLTASQAGTVTIGVPCASCQPTHDIALDPIPGPPGGAAIWPSDSGARPVLIADRTTGAAGDVLGLFYAGDVGGTWYLLRSADGGASFQYLAASNAEPDASGDRQPWSYAIAQDGQGFKVHTVWSRSAESQARYNRVALAHGAGGHVTGWSWEAENVPGPSFLTGGSWMGFAKLGLQEVIDGNGKPLLLLVGMDQPSDTRIQRLLACRTAGGSSAALAPAGPADWRKPTDVGTSGCDVVAAYSSGAVDAADAGAFLRLANQPYDWLREHTSDFTFAQVGADRSLHLFDGPMYYDDAWVGAASPGEIRRWRLAASGASWTLDVNGQVVAAGDSQTRATVGAAYGTANHAWFSYGGTDGLHVDRSEGGSAWTRDAVPSPDGTEHAWWWSALSVSPDETAVYLSWERDRFSPGSVAEKAGYHDGTSWTILDESSLFTRDPAWGGSGSAYPGASNWTPIQLGAGVGVMCYPYSQWMGSPSYHVHLLR
jgi:hypothetical protein